MMEQTLREAVAAIKGVKLPELPEEVALLERELESRFVNSINVARIIEQNTTLSGEVLRIANSPIMKLKSPARTIREAVDMLGLDNIRNLVVSAMLQRLFGSGAIYKEIMSHSVDVAFCMADLSEWVAGVSRDEAYMLGLFHNAGCLMLATKDPEGYSKFFSQSQSTPVSVLDKEYQAYGSTHCAIGVLLGKKWHLPIDMLSAILLHHTAKCDGIKSDKVRAMVALLKIANSIVSEISLGAYRGQEMRDYELDGQHELMIDPDVVKEIRLALMNFSSKD